MHKFRSTWLALIGGAFLVTLSISAAFGADPADETSNRGQTIAGFVHDLVLGDNAPDDEVDQDEDTDEVDEDGDDADEADEDADEADEDADEADETDED